MLWNHVFNPWTQYKQQTQVSNMNQKLLAFFKQTVALPIYKRGVCVHLPSCRCTHVWNSPSSRVMSAGQGRLKEWYIEWHGDGWGLPGDQLNNKKLILLATRSLGTCLQRGGRVTTCQGFSFLLNHSILPPSPRTILPSLLLCHGDQEGVGGTLTTTSLISDDAI